MSLAAEDVIENDHESRPKKSPSRDDRLAEFRISVSLLASSRPDTLNSKNRKALVDNILQSVVDTNDDDDDEDDDENDDNGDNDNGRESIAIAYREVLANWNDLHCSSTHAFRRSVSLYAQSLIVQQQAKSGTENEKILYGLVSNLVRLLYESKEESLVEYCQTLFTEQLVSEDKSQITAMLFEFATSSSSSNSSLPAVALGSSLDSNINSTDNQDAQSTACRDWLSLVLKTSLSELATRDDLVMAKAFFQSVTLDQWHQTISPALQLKLKSHPDKCLETILGWIQHVSVARLNSEWMSLLIKHLQSPKDANRQLTSELLIVWAKHSEEDLCTCVQVLSRTKVSLAPARVQFYETLEIIARNVNMADEVIPIPDNIIGCAIAGIIEMIGKETKSDQRLLGQQALVEWLLTAAKRQKSLPGYSTALNYIREPVCSKKGAMAGTLFGLMIQRIHPDMLETIVLDLWVDTKERKKWEQGLEAIVEAASNKKSVQIDALLVIYFTLVYCSRSGEKIPSFVDAVVSVGGKTAGSLNKKENISFLYSNATLDAASSTPLISHILLRSVALYTELAAKRIENGRETFADLFPKGKLTMACQAMACAICHPTIISEPESATKDQYASNVLITSLETVLTYQPLAADGLVLALFKRLNDAALEFETLVKGLNATREAREADKEISVKGQGSVNASHRGFDTNAVRLAARVLSRSASNAEYMAYVLVMMHAGTSLRSEGHQRAALIVNTKRVIENVIVPLDKCDEHFRSQLAEDIVQICASHPLEAASKAVFIDIVSNSVYESALSLLTSLGGIACNYDVLHSDDDEEVIDMVPYAFASKLCINHIAALLDKRFRESLKRVEELSEKEVLLYLSPTGTLFNLDENISIAMKKSGGKRLSEEEEWELQLKKELAEKKKKEHLATTGSLPTAMSEMERKHVVEQDIRRDEISSLLYNFFVRAVESVQYLCVSDIEVGNQCLPIVMESVLRAATSICPAATLLPILRTRCTQVLTHLATCVYEIHEMHAITIAQALLISCRQEGSNRATEVTDVALERNEGLTCKELPSPCAPAACVVNEMDQFGNTFSGASFAFLFPVLRSALMGPRTPAGCEGALRVLERQTLLLEGDEIDTRVSALRRDMAIAVLELLKHDRSQTFQNPTAFEALVACYKVGKNGGNLTTAELAPILDERGALGSKSCRIGAMLVLQYVANHQNKLVKGNPLVENRIWLNCFAHADDIRTAARRAWLGIHEETNCDPSNDAALPPPSPLYATPLTPLLHHSDASIALAAAAAFGTAMGKHPKSVPRNAERLCNTFIDAIPVDVGSVKETSASTRKNTPSVQSIVAAPKKMTAATAMPKRKNTAPMSSLAAAGIGKPKPALKKKLANNSLLKPKEERVLAQDEFENQFKVGHIKKDSEKDSVTKRATRLGVIRAIVATTQSVAEIGIDEPTLKLLTSFLMAYGIADIDSIVNAAARDALRDVVALNGGSDTAVAFLLPHLEEVLKSGNVDEKLLGSLSSAKVPKNIDASDRRKEAVVIALGSVALHLKGPENASKIDNTIDMLIAALKTPSEDVQLSVADALTKLVKKGRTQDRLESLLPALLRDCLNGDSLAVQRGSAYGLAAFVKGSGIASLRKYEIVKKIEEACSTGNSKVKEGSLFAIELLSDRLGLLFEPYVISLLPSLLKCFSDGSEHVRKAAANTVGVIMGKLSAHGVKLVMPAVLTAFDDPAWRTKQASIHMLGSMSHLAPKQLASALPKVVPKLTEAFGDTHPKVKGSAQEALNEISKVVRNPEISEISPALLRALTDPADFTAKALETLIETEFLHAIDAPSLALIVPILHRGLRDRGATTKRFSGLITGNITTMINDPKDLVPYLPTLLPDLQNALLDPIPDVRSTAAKALGSLTRSLGDHILPDLRPWLIKKLRDNACSSAERSGAAQGLTEVLIASGSNVVEEAMRNELLPLCHSSEPSTREGLLWLLVFLPPAMGQGFTSLIDASFPVLIGGLSDDSELVRDTALRAGRVLIRSHGKVHVDKILPSLEEGLGNDDSRIRLASLSLLGDMLSMIGGTTLVKGDGDTQDDIRRAERAQAQLALGLGSDTRKRVLSGLYLARSDSVHVVRQSALQVWKTVVSVTGRTLKEILPVLVSKVIVDLASGNELKTMVAGRCLGDIVSKLGESVLPQIIPVLRNALYDGDEHTKCGVCVGLSDVIKCSTKDQILRFIAIVAKVVQDALCDDSDSVRKMAASSFQTLHAVVGNRAFDEIVPSLMVGLETHDEKVQTKALHGLTGILTVRSRELLPYIVPRLIARPITKDHAKALAAVASVTGGTLYFYYSSIVPALLGDLADEAEGIDGHDYVRDCCRSICSYCDEAGVNILISEIVSKCGNDKPPLRRECCRMLELLIVERAEMRDYYDHIAIIIRELLYRLNDDDTAVLKATNSAFLALSNAVQSEELVKHVEFMRNLLSSMVSDARRRKGGVGDKEFLLPGFNMPKGLDPLIPIYQRGILCGNPTIREISAIGLGEAIELTSTKFLAGPLIIKVTGPLLRIVGDRNPSNVKVAILKTLGLVLVKGGSALRAFVPQFQTTFVKALSDPSRQVRLEAISALSLLMPLSTRVDPLIKELVTSSLGKGLNAEGLAACAIQTASLEALTVVLEKGGTKAKLPTSIPTALDASKELLKGSDDGIREAAAKVMGAACALLPKEVVLETVEDEILDPLEDESSFVRHGKACAIFRLLDTDAANHLESVLPDLQRLCKTYWSDEKTFVREAACVAMGAVIGRSSDPKASFIALQKDLLAIMTNSREPIEIHRALARGLCVALSKIDGDSRLDTMGIPLVDTSLQLALSGTQKVQYAYNDVLWMVLNVENGQEGLTRYTSMAVFDNVRAMKSLHSKVLLRQKEAALLKL